MKEQPQQRKIPLEILLWILKILIPLAVLLPVVYFSYSLVQGRLEDLANLDTEGYFSGTGLYLFASHILLFAICVGHAGGRDRTLGSLSVSLLPHPHRQRANLSVDAGRAVANRSFILADLPDRDADRMKRTIQKATLFVGEGSRFLLTKFHYQRIMNHALVLRVILSEAELLRNGRRQPNGAKARGRSRAGSTKDLCRLS